MCDLTQPEQQLIFCAIRLQVTYARTVTVYVYIQANQRVVVQVLASVELCMCDWVTT